MEGNKSRNRHENVDVKSKAQSSLDKPESSLAAGKGSGKLPYCYRCYTKGHKLTECTAKLYCDICDCVEHARERCHIYHSVQPDHHRITPFVATCGYAVDGLGFYYINPPESFKHKVESKAAVIQVTGGSLTIVNVISEMERLIPGTWRWNVEEAGRTLFRTMFPSRAELQRMVEWGVASNSIHRYNNEDSGRCWR